MLRLSPAVLPPAHSQVWAVQGKSLICLISFKAPNPSKPRKMIAGDVKGIGKSTNDEYDAKVQYQPKLYLGKRRFLAGFLVRLAEGGHQSGAQFQSAIASVPCCREIDGCRGRDGCRLPD